MIDELSTDVKKWVMREYFRYFILRRVSGNERAAWSNALTSVVRGRTVRINGIVHHIPLAESHDECNRIAQAIINGEASFL